MSEFTPGPWKCGTEEPFVYALNEAGTNRFFCAVQSGWITDGNKNRADDQRAPIDEMQANASLIAAAPDLYDALRAVLEGMEASGGWKGDDGLFDAGMAAIRKAEGQ